MRDLQALNPPLPQTIRNHTPQGELRLIADMIADGWIEGLPLPDHIGSGLTAIRVNRITGAGLKALDGDKWFKKAKRVFELNRLKIIAGLVASLVGIAVGVRTLFPPKQKPETSRTSASATEPTPLGKTHSQENSSPTATPVAKPLSYSGPCQSPFRFHCFFVRHIGGCHLNNVF